MQVCWQPLAAKMTALRPAPVSRAFKPAFRRRFNSNKVLSSIRKPEISWPRPSSLSFGGSESIACRSNFGSERIISKQPILPMASRHLATCTPAKRPINSREALEPRYLQAAGHLTRVGAVFFCPPLRVLRLFFGYQIESLPISFVQQNPIYVNSRIEVGAKSVSTGVDLPIHFAHLT